MNNPFLIIYLYVYFCYKCIKIYIIKYIPENFVIFNNKTIIVKNDLDYSIISYKYKHNNKFYDIRLISSLDCKNNEINKNIDKNIKNKYKIFHACIINDDKKYIKDITYDIRSFSHYFNCELKDFKDNEYIKYIKNYLCNENENINIHLSNYIEIQL